METQIEGGSYLWLNWEQESNSWFLKDNKDAVHFQSVVLADRYIATDKMSFRGFVLDRAKDADFIHNVNV